MSSHITPGRLLLTLPALVSSFGSFAADWSVTHVFNPRWPPHAKFHNGQTMTMGVCLALASLYYAYRTPSSLPHPLPPQARSNNSPELRAARQSVTVAAVFGSLYWVSGLSAVLYPGAKGTDPEFGEGFPQGWGFAGCFVVNWVGWWFEMRRLGGL